MAAVLAVAAMTPGGLVALATPATAAVPTGSAWAVSLGDSYISGEAGRWAGNSNDSSQTDALGSTAYWDTSTGEAIVGCHRSKSAEIAFGTIYSKNLACSGAKTA